MIKALLTILALLGLFLSPPAQAQHVLFEEDFSAGLSRWSRDAPWHVTHPQNVCASQSNPPLSNGGMARMGDQGSGCGFVSTCSFIHGTCNPRVLQSVEYFQIPVNAVNPRLEFDSFVDMEACAPDIPAIIVQVEGASTTSTIGHDCATGPWHSTSLDLSQWAGERISIGFRFFTIDEINNDGLGWLIDNVRIIADCASENYCVASANSASPTGAIIGSAGSLQLAQNNFALTLQDGPPGQFGVFFYGPYQGQTPVAQGFLCVGADQFGFRRLFPAGQVDAQGGMVFPLDFTALTGAHRMLPGTVVNFQCWYRDMINGASTSNFSNALSVSFCP